MMNIYQTVRLFSNLDLSTGNQFAQPFLYMSNSFQDVGEKVLLGNGIEIDKRKNVVKIGNQEISINSLFVTAYDSQGRLQKQQQRFSASAPLSIVYMKSYNKFLVVDQQTFNSTYFQLFVLENYDPELFEPVIMTPLAKVYRLKK
jgi:dolichyl-diphosphooligosaccharide--protein glycosyltransferase/undecaprenyl-diphosphooligosaccharide--protein glycosyltransferase